MAKKSTASKKASESVKKVQKKVAATKKNLASKRTSKRSSGSKARDTSSKLKTYSNVSAKRRKKRDVRSKRKAEYLASLPKSRVKRIAYRLNPKRLREYWFSKQGGIMALKIAGVGFVFMIVMTLAVFAFFRRDLPNPREINNRLLSQTTKFYDRTGEHILFELYGEQNRTVVEFDQISDYAKWATVAIEDKDFYNHGGFSISGITRAAWNNVFGGETQGGSTITQQFIKNSLLTNEQTITRKVKELILSIELERLYSKDEILSFYLNEIPYGAQEYGVEAAAQSFFAKSAKDLGIAESAMLAALPQAPSYYSPYGDNNQELVERAHVIIDLMKDQGYISEEEANTAKEVDLIAKVTPIEKRSLYRNIEAPHFVLEIQRQLEEEFGPSLIQTGGLNVITTLDYEMQKIAEEAVANNIATVIAPANGAGSGDNTALVATDNQTGHILAYVGSRDFNYPGYGSFDAATPGLGRQPGSSFKPFAYAELFKNERWGPDSKIYDTPTSFGNYNPKNFDFGYRGDMTVRQALGESRNIPAVKALYIAGVENTINLTKSMGNKSLGDASQYGLSLVLGAGEVKLSEHTHAYSTFARGGVHKDQTYVLKVENADGEILKEWQDSEGEQVLDPQIAYLLTDAIADDGARSGTFGRGNPRLVVPGLTHTVKTGTTDLSVDGWMMGYSRYITTGVWAGNHDSKPMNSITSWQTGPIFTEFMRRAHFDVLFEKRGLSDVPIFENQPDGIKNIAMDRATGYAATDKTKDRYNGIFPSWHVNQTPEETGSEVEIDTVSNKLATECTPDRARDKVTSSAKWPELLSDDPFFNLWAKSAGYSKSGSITEKDDVHKCSDKLPNVSLSTSDQGNGAYKITATISKGTHKLDTLNFKIDGQIASSQSVSSNGTYTYTHTFTKNDSYKVAAEVIDEALYDNSNSKNLNVTDAGSASEISIFSPASGASTSGDVSITWSQSGSTGDYRICIREVGGGAFDCFDDTDGDEQYTISDGSFETNVPGDGYQIYVYALNGGSEVSGTRSGPPYRIFNHN